MTDIQVGSTITNGSSAGRVIARVGRDPHWRSAGWTLVNIGMSPFDGNPGMTSFVPDYLAASWRHVPFEWTPVVGGGLEERYVWAPGWRWLQREVRPIETADCRSDHGVGHPDCPKCWRWSERNPNRVARRDTTGGRNHQITTRITDTSADFVTELTAKGVEAGVFVELVDETGGY